MKVHPLAELVPDMRPSEYQELVEDIKTNGLREPITLYEGKVLDGRHRARACEELGVKPEFREYKSGEPAGFVISMNVHRRHLTVSQRGEIARLALPRLREEAKRRQREHGGTAPGRTANTSGHGSGTVLEARNQAGKLVGVSGRTVAELDQLAKKAPELHREVIAGKRHLRKTLDEVRDRQNGKEKAKPGEIKTERHRQIAEAAKRRVETLVGTCQGLARGLPELKVENAAQVADAEEVEGWIECVKGAETALRLFRKRITNRGEIYA